jgi:intracellular multiplication protein IcmG
MADYNNNDNNDEYHFEETDAPGAQSMDELDDKQQTKKEPVADPSAEKGETARKAVSLLVVLVMLVMSYKFVAYLFSSKPKPEPQAVTDVTKTQNLVEPVAIQNATQPLVAQSETTILNKELEQKVSAIELIQDTVKTQVTSVNEKVGVVSTNIDNLNVQIGKLNQVIEQLSNQVNRQSNEINILIARTKPRQIKQQIAHHVARVYYYIQAVIPGRAWLIGSNGSTLSVREGTRIPEYGLVKLIDSLQGRVLTSSGRVIRFSQEDS